MYGYKWETNRPESCTQTQKMSFGIKRTTRQDIKSVKLCVNSRSACKWAINWYPAEKCRNGIRKTSYFILKQVCCSHPRWTAVSCFSGRHGRGRGCGWGGRSIVFLSSGRFGGLSVPASIHPPGWEHWWSSGAWYHRRHCRDLHSVSKCVGNTAPHRQWSKHTHFVIMCFWSFPSFTHMHVLHHCPVTLFFFFLPF